MVSYQISNIDLHLTSCCFKKAQKHLQNLYFHKRFLFDSSFFFCPYQMKTIQTVNITIDFTSYSLQAILLNNADNAFTVI